MKKILSFVVYTLCLYAIGYTHGISTQKQIPQNEAVFKVPVYHQAPNEIKPFAIAFTLDRYCAAWENNLNKCAKVYRAPGQKFPEKGDVINTGEMASWKVNENDYWELTPNPPGHHASVLEILRRIASFDQVTSVEHAF